MRRTILTIAVLLLSATLVTGAGTVTPEQFAAFFQIENRPPEITSDHLPYLAQLHGFGESSGTYQLLAENVPISTEAELSALCEEHGRKLTKGKCFLLRALFDLDGEEQASQPPSGGDRGLITAQVTRVIDGDTIEAELPDGTTEDVRYIGMDTPETHGGVECFGREASAYNERLVADRTVWLELDVEERDRYGRLLAYVYLDSDGQAMVNAVLLSQGFAQLLTIPPNVKYAERFQALQREAREAQRGLWQACQSAY